MNLCLAFLNSAHQHPDAQMFLAVEGKQIHSTKYSTAVDVVKGIAGGLLRSGVDRGDRVAIISENCQEWMLFDLACQAVGAVLVPIYPTLLPDQISYIVKDSGSKLIVCGGDDLVEKVRGIKGVHAMQLRGAGGIVASSGAAPIDDEDFIRQAALAQEDDLFTIIYTSGTTGEPKGVVLTHGAFLHVCRAAAENFDITQDDVFLSFLPMSHVFERIVEYFAIYIGASTCVSKSLMSLPNEMRVIRPTIVGAVPRFLENMRDRVLDQISKEPPLRRRLFALTLSQGSKKAKGQFAPLTPVLDALVASKIRERVGGRLRFFISAGAALAPAVAEFYMAMGLTVLQGYGLTETSGGSFLNRPSNNRYWTVGEALNVECKIAPDGEILIRGPAVMKGYWNKPKDTVEAIDAAGWFHTGDIGAFEGDHLKITDRKKDLIVLANGKNIAPQPIENHLKESEFISEAVVLGDGMDHCVALIVPQDAAVRAKLGIGPSDALAGDGRVRALMKQDVDRLNATLANFEQVKRFAILDGAFSVDSGELTPTLKVKRKVVTQKYADVIATLL